MNPLIVTIVIALATFILSIFTANWLNQQHVNKLMEQLEKRLEEQGKRYTKVMQANFATMDEWFRGMGQRFGSIENRLDRMERQMEAIFKPSLPR